VTIAETGVITLRVRTFNPAYSQLLARRLIELLIEYDRAADRTHAGAEVAFLATSATRAHQELERSETRLAAFLSANRRFSNASSLALVHDRLDREVLDRRANYAALAEALERANIDEARSAHVISVLSSAEIPARADPRGIARTTFIGLVGGVALALLVALLRAHLSRLRAAGSAEFAGFVTLWSDALPAARLTKAARATPYRRS
jgi:uncharacterized protein involved in exopolysaccharide biosynthesis